MDIYALLDKMRELQPNLDTVTEFGTSLITVGGWAVKLLKTGNQIITFAIQKAADDDAEVPEKATKNVAIIVEISQQIVAGVQTYLDENEIEADLIVINNNPKNPGKIQFLDPENSEEWDRVAYEFADAMNAIKRFAGGQKLHIFQATPVPLSFALGTIWGTVTEGATMYHYQNDTYYPVLSVNRLWRQGK